MRVKKVNALHAPAGVINPVLSFTPNDTRRVDDTLKVAKGRFKSGLTSRFNALDRHLKIKRGRYVEKTTTILEDDRRKVIINKGPNWKTVFSRNLPADNYICKGEKR